jgi:micrococcal nuclease
MFELIEWAPATGAELLAAYLLGVVGSVALFYLAQWIFQGGAVMASGLRRITKRLGGRGAQPDGDETIRGEVAVVETVLDGDTIVTEAGDTIRVIGMDAPESEPCEKLHRDARETGMDMLSIMKRGKKAADWVRRLVEGQTVVLEVDPAFAPSHVGAYGRKLAHVWVVGPERERVQAGEEGTGFLLSEAAIEWGHALPSKEVHKYVDELFRAKRQAAANGRGRGIGVPEVQRADLREWKRNRRDERGEAEPEDGDVAPLAW